MAAGVARPIPLPVPREELKMVLCVNHSLGMGKGKIGAASKLAGTGLLGRTAAAVQALVQASASVSQQHAAPGQQGSVMTGGAPHK
jgi:hypothetical protein